MTETKTHMMRPDTWKNFCGRGDWGEVDFTETPADDQCQRCVKLASAFIRKMN